jgi:hypothetical protein
MMCFTPTEIRQVILARSSMARSVLSGRSPGRLESICVAVEPDLVTASRLLVEFEATDLQLTDDLAVAKSSELCASPDCRTRHRHKVCVGPTSFHQPGVRMSIGTQKHMPDLMSQDIP